MTERESPRFVAAHPLEVTQKKDGTEVLYGVVASDEGAVDELAREIEEETGARLINKTRWGSDASFFFSSSNWNSSWEPSGERRPQIVQPRDPSHN